MKVEYASNFEVFRSETFVMQKFERFKIIRLLCFHGFANSPQRQFVGHVLNWTDNLTKKEEFFKMNYSKETDFLFRHLSKKNYPKESQNEIFFHFSKKLFFEKNILCDDRPRSWSWHKVVKKEKKKKFFRFHVRLSLMTTQVARPKPFKTVRGPWQKSNQGSILVFYCIYFVLYSPKYTIHLTVWSIGNWADLITKVPWKSGGPRQIYLAYRLRRLFTELWRSQEY